MPRVRALPPVAAAIVLGVSVLAGAVPALAADSSPAPSAEELWRAYPLDPEGSDADGEGATNPPPARGERSGEPRGDRTATVVEGESNGGAWPAVLLPGLVVLGVAALVLVRRRRAARDEPGRSPERDRPEPEPTAEPASAVTREPALAPASRPDRGPPPEPDRPWTAEVVWRATDGTPRFVVVATSEDGEATALVAASDPVDWPPAGPADVAALHEVVRDLDAALVAAGWTAEPSGDTWFARRFRWVPGVRAPAAGPTPAAPDGGVADTAVADGPRIVRRARGSAGRGDAAGRFARHQQSPEVGERSGAPDSGGAKAG